MKNFLLQGLAVAIFLMGIACSSGQNDAEQANETSVQSQWADDQGNINKEFMRRAYSQNMLMIEINQRAIQQASSQQVKDFAQESLNEHNEIKQQFEALADQVQVKLPDSLQDEEQSKVEDLVSADETEFDHKYVNLLDDTGEEMLNDLGRVNFQVENLKLYELIEEVKKVVRKHNQLLDQMEGST